MKWKETEFSIQTNKGLLHNFGINNLYVLIKLIYVCLRFILVTVPTANSIDLIVKQ